MNFANLLKNDVQFPLIHTVASPFSQVMPTLMEEDSEWWKSNPHVVIVWTRPEDVCASFSCVLKHEEADIDLILEEVDKFTSLLLNIRNRARIILVPTWVAPTYYHNMMGILDMKAGVGLANTLMRMNIRLADNLTKEPNIYLLNTHKWVELTGKRAFNPKLWYMGKIAFGNDVFVEAVRDIKSTLRGILGRSKKLIILDLDDTLWGGIVGDVGWENIKLGGHDYLGEAYRDFQLALKSLSNRGILLGVVSKNDEKIALEAIKRHPEMVLHIEDFAGIRINWNDKAQNIVELVSELNLGFDTVVFIDDNPVERNRVRDALPEIFVPEWPEDKTIYKSTLFQLSCFDTAFISKEDIERTKMYVSDRIRKDLKGKISSLDEWLKSLNTVVKVEPLNESNLKRATQLFNKTNQINLTTRRMTDTELMRWAHQEGNKLWTFSVSDKFGSSGLTGLTSLSYKDHKGQIVDFVLSCRVMGRKIEETMLYTIISYSKSVGLEEIIAEYIQTPKNKPCLEFWRRSGFGMLSNSDNIFMWNLKDIYPFPESIQIEVKN